ncbi:hypothetical protein GOV09_00740 [Candidatus Woesearchaeota archaeon]|nr:hypothetical protein [Candidatus Woesearchaeota archaeon]
MKVREMMKELESEKISTWFDLGLFMDRLRENRINSPIQFEGTLESFKKRMAKGVAFITFSYSVDGITMECAKYAKIFRSILNKPKIHYIAGEFHPESTALIHPDVKKFQVDEIAGFEKWDLYNDFFHKKIFRGDIVYNNLIKKFWKETIVICRKLGKYIEGNDIKLLYLLNINSNPGNVSLALACVLLSEYLKIPVICNNHDFYWDGGNKKVDIKTKGLKPGPRDFFFTNSDVGEFFSIINVLFPWESKSWISVNINRNQSKVLIERLGHNPANVTEIGTAIDLDEFKSSTERRKIETFIQISKVLSRYKRKISVMPIDQLPGDTFDKSVLPFITGHRRGTIDFIENNIVFLQPTRIIERKRIEVNFTLITKLFHHPEFTRFFNNNKKLTLTLLITGPIAEGHTPYIKKLLSDFSTLLKTVPPGLKDRIFLAFIFSEIDRHEFKKRFSHPIHISDIYNIANLILLPSETEGRGLPIIESAASRSPIFTRRYYPTQVYAEVIGEHLSSDQRLRVIEFSNDSINISIVNDIVNRIIHPHEYLGDADHNRGVVESRYSMHNLQKNMESILHSLYLQLLPQHQEMKATILEMGKYERKLTRTYPALNDILHTKNRQYLPGYGKMAFMIYLKSLIDPSYFRVEEQETKGRAFQFAKYLIESYAGTQHISKEKVHAFYNCVDNIFHYKNGSISVRIDHSFSYRHRNKDLYPYGKFTHQEITGVINLLFNSIIKPQALKIKYERRPHHLTDIRNAFCQLADSFNLYIDHSSRLIKKLRSNVPIAYFPGKHIRHELEIFVVHTVRERLGLSLEQPLTEKELLKKKLAPIFVIKQRKPLGNYFTADELRKYLLLGANYELRLLYKHNICKIVTSEQMSVGIDFRQLGKRALNTLSYVKKNHGFIVTFGENSAMMTDIVDLETFHIGKVKNIFTSKVMGIPLDSGFIEWVPPGLRPTIAYPTPIQTSAEFSTAFHSKLYRKLCKEYGEKAILNILRKDAEEKGSPVTTVLKYIDKQRKKGNNDVEYSYVRGVYVDGLPWSGVIAKANLSNSKKKWTFNALFSSHKPHTAQHFIRIFERRHKGKARIVWNGGYILNAELVGKLGLSKSYIGSPLGLVISDNKIISPPLFNKPAILFHSTGKLEIRRVNCSKGMIISYKRHTYALTKKHYNQKKPGDYPCFYDLMHSEDTIEGNGRTIYRLAGNSIKEIIKTKKGERIGIIPVGLTLSFPKNKVPIGWDIGSKVSITMDEFKNVLHGIEAGPVLLKNEKIAIEMEKEGWKSSNSIKTQAARIDYVDMRGPKIAVGLDKKGDLSVLVVNGRIRESVGATHRDMARILLKHGMVHAMGFDPGGSSTLVVDGKILNISPFNHDYEHNPYSLPPEPRPISNVFIGWQ